MQPFVVVVAKIPPQPPLGLRRLPILLQVHLLVFHASPQPLREHVVQGATASVHADPNPALLQSPREGLAGELGPLIGVENLRVAESRNASARASTQNSLSRLADSRQLST